MFTFVKNSIGLLYCLMIFNFLGCQKVAQHIPKPVPPETLVTLMEQVRGKKLHWDHVGNDPSYIGPYGFKGTEKPLAREYAIVQLQDFPLKDLKDLVPELIQLFQRKDDLHHYDGFPIRYRSEIAKLLAIIGDSSAIDPLIEMLADRSHAQDKSKVPGDVPWHSRNWKGNPRVLGVGPQGILMALMLFPEEYHDSIVTKLQAVRVKVANSKLNNDWTIFEIDRAIVFLTTDSETKARGTEFLRHKNTWHRMDRFEERCLNILK